MKKPIAKMSIPKKEVVKKVVKQIPIEKAIVKKPIKAKPNAKTLSKEVKVITKIIKPLFKKPIVPEIIYSWDLENIEINNSTNVIVQITYEFIGILNDQKYALAGTITLPKDVNPNSKVETGDYRNLLKEEIIDYIINNVSERHIETMKGLIIQNFNGSKIIDKTFWKS
jgi:hypothetical protein